MGVVHKLKPEILNFIIANKQNNPTLSCRNLTSLILEQLQIQVSKSSINAVFKENNLSMPIGRRRKLKKKKFNMPVLPVIEEINVSGLDDLSQKIVQEQEKIKALKEKATQEAARIKSMKENRLGELGKLVQETEGKRKRDEELRNIVEEKAAQEAEEKRKREEEALKIVEEKAAQETASIKALEESRLRELEKLAQEAEENKRKQEEARKLEEEAAQELARIKAQKEARLRELEKLVQEAEENKRKQEEARKFAEEKAAQETARIKAQEEARLRELEKLVQEAEEKRKREEEARKLEEEKAAQEAAAQETARIKALEEAKLRDLEKAAQELARIKAQEEARLLQLEKLAQEAEENKRKQEEARKQEELRKLQEEKAVQEAEQKTKQLASKNEEVVLPKVEPSAPVILPQDRVCSGAIILKALDYLIGGSREINAAISRATGGNPEDSRQLTETLIFKSLFGKDNFSTLGDLVGVQYPQEKLSSYFSQIKQITDIGLDVTKIISNLFTEAKGVKVHFIDGSVIHLDGQLYSSWPASRFPDDFSNLALDLKNKLNKYFLSGQALVLFSPPGYDILPKDFFNLLLNIGSKNNSADSLALFGNQLEELETISLNPQNQCALVFGLWPWQFTSGRKVKKIGDFYLKYIKEIDRDLYLGEIEIDLFRASLNQSITLKGCAVKTDLKDKIRLVILSNNQQTMNLDELAGIYLSRWPNFEEAFQDFSRKIELFTYAAGTEQKSFPKDSFGMDAAGLTMELPEIFANYIKMLDAYLRWHFLPTEYMSKDISVTSQYFYKLPVKLVASQSRVKARTLVSQDYEFLKDLEYLNCRLNERQIKAANDKLFWFESAFK